MTAPVYQNPDMAVERLVTALAWNFRQITLANGYSHDIGDVVTELPAAGDIKNYPMVALIRGQTVIENEDLSDGEWHKRIPFVALTFLKTEDPTNDRIRVCADFEAMLGNNCMVTGEDGSVCARIATLDGDRPFGMYLNKPQVGFAFGFSMRLAQLISDPSVTA